MSGYSGGALGEGNIKGWVDFNSIGTLSIKDSFNVNGVSDFGIGYHQVFWDIDFASADYCVHATHNQGPSRVQSKTAATIAFETFSISSSPAKVDDASICVSAIGEQ